MGGVLADFYCTIFLKLNNPRKGQTFKVTLSQITRGFGVSLNLSKNQNKTKTQNSSKFIHQKGKFLTFL